MSLLALGHLKTLIAATAKWQSLTGAANAAAAAAFIHQFGKHSPAAAPPFIALTNRAGEWERAGSYNYAESGTIRMVLELPRRKDTYPVLENEYVAVQTDVDALVAQMLDLAGEEVGGVRYLEISRFSMEFISLNDPRVPDAAASWRWSGALEWP